MSDKSFLRCAALSGAALAALTCISCASSGSSSGSVTSFDDVGDVQVTDRLPTPEGEAFPTSGDESFRPGDVVEMEVYRVDSLTGTFEVNETGTVEFPLLGKVRVEGRTAQELEDFLEERYGAEYLQDPDIIVARDPQQIGKFVIDGSVAKPGVYEMFELVRLSEAIALAGGTEQNANLRRVLVIRTLDGRRYVSEHDLNVIRERGAVEPLIYPDDSVFVDDSTVNRAIGEVLRTVPLLGVIVRGGY